MKPAIRAILELFVEKANELTEEEFTRFIQEFGHQLQYSYTAEPQQFTVETTAPTQTMHKSFLLTYRMFVQGSEHMRFIDPTKPISRELLDESLSRRWHEQIQAVTQKVHAFLRDTSSIRFNFQLVDPQGNVSTEIPTNWDILETLLYGYFSHASHRQRLRNWLSNPFAPLIQNMLMMEFRNILLFTLRGIQHLAYVARLELDAPEPDNPFLSR